MALDDAAFQWALARLLTEPALAERLLAEPEAAAQALGLDAQQVQALMTAGPRRLRNFAHSLASKRLGLLHKTCPATDARLQQHPRRRELQARFLREHPPLETPEYPNRSLRDGFWMTAFLVRLQAEGELNDALLGDVARFEHALLQVTSLAEALDNAERWDRELRADPDGPAAEALWAARPVRGAHVRVEHFAGDIVGAIKRLVDKLPVDALEARPCSILFSKQPGWRNVRYASINALTHALLMSCDGARTTADVVEHLARSHGRLEDAAFAQGCLETLRRLRSMNVLRLAA